MMNRLFPFVLVLGAGLGLGLVACGDDTADGEVDCDATPPKTYAELSSVWSKCTNCHATTLTDLTARQAAPLGTDYDTYDAAKAAGSKTKSRVADGTMPPAGSPTLSDQEKTDLYAWVDCGMPQ